VRRVLVPSAALFWGLQFAFLNPALALLLVTLFDATAAEVGWVLAVYNASGFVASLVLPAYADRKEDYLRPMLACGLLTLVLAGVLASTTALPVAHLKHSGADLADVVNTRAIVSFAWVAGPPVATFIMSGFGNRAILAAIAGVAVLNVVTTAAMLNRRSSTDAEPPRAAAPDDDRPMSRPAVAVIVAAFIGLQATNTVVVSIMTLFVTTTLGLDVIWAGVALGVAAGFEIPALLVIGRLSRRFSSLTLLASGCVAGIVYYVAMAYVSGPVLLVALQVVNAWFFAAVAGVGLTLFQEIIPRPGLASGLYVNTRRLGAIVSGPIITFGSTTSLGNAGIFAVCAALTVVALVMILSRQHSTWRRVRQRRSRCGTS
jgi:SET family sugar efflux transporter-like MFS transporter